MKYLKLVLFLLVIATIASVVTAVGVRRQPAQTASGQSVTHYQVRGKVRGINGSTVRIKHEEIPGYMAAMIMPFEVKDATLVRGLRVGDEIGFELAVTENDSWISRIDRLSAAASANGTEVQEIAAKDVQRVQTGERVPDFALLDQHGRGVRLSDYRGKAVLLTFIYTRCPLPNYCPLMSKNFASLQERLEKAFPGKFELLSVTMDPQFDTPEVLKDYGVRFSKADATWTFATGTPEQTDAVGALFGLIHERAGGLINHDLRTALIGPDGKLIHVWKSNYWTPYEVQRRVAETLGQSSN